MRLEPCPLHLTSASLRARASADATLRATSSPPSAATLGPASQPPCLPSFSLFQASRRLSLGRTSRGHPSRGLARETPRSRDASLVPRSPVAIARVSRLPTALLAARHCSPVAIARPPPPARPAAIPPSPATSLARSHLSPAAISRTHATLLARHLTRPRPPLARPPLSLARRPRSPAALTRPPPSLARRHRSPAAIVRPLRSLARPFLARPLPRPRPSLAHGRHSRAALLARGLAHLHPRTHHLEMLGRIHGRTAQRRGQRRPVIWHRKLILRFVSLPAFVCDLAAHLTAERRRRRQRHCAAASASCQN
jgi:hypothetical protein